MISIISCSAAVSYTHLDVYKRQGKNNVGKTTVIEVLDKLINRERAFKATDFNFIYLRELLSTYSLEVGELDKVKLPCMEFIVEIGRCV